MWLEPEAISCDPEQDMQVLGAPGSSSELCGIVVCSKWCSARSCCGQAEGVTIPGLTCTSSSASMRQIPLCLDQLGRRALPGPVLNADRSQGAYVSSVQQFMSVGETSQCWVKRTC